MSRWSAPRRAALLGIAAALSAFVIIGAYLYSDLRHLQTLRDHATAHATGVVIEDHIGDEDDIRVRWTDAAGQVHVRRFGIYNTDRYTQGTAFEIAYDPMHPTRRPFPTDPEEISDLDDREVPIGLAGIGAALYVAAWGARGLLFRMRGAQPATRMSADSLVGGSISSSPLALGASAWIVLTDDEGHRAWQRVMWRPELDDLMPQVEVVVHGTLTNRRRVVVELSAGTRLVPIGRLRHAPPRTINVRQRERSGGEADDLFVIPENTPLPSAVQWSRRVLRFAALGAGLGAILGWTFGGGTALLPMTVASAAVVLNGWALGGAEP